MATKGLGQKAIFIEFIVFYMVFQAIWSLMWSLFLLTTIPGDRSGGQEIFIWTNKFGLVLEELLFTLPIVIVTFIFYLVSNKSSKLTLKLFFCLFLIFVISDQTIFLLLSPDIRLSSYLNKRVLVTGLYDKENNTIQIKKPTDIEILP